ncbi:MFS transporter [Peribacillus deserti]|uniref:MFS transporter n=1 Tax=Peribacillus deserti TaxID=673318 RepID=A0A2N5M6I1_9BACI|nr:MFS transporter [Peribacillus deserti]PLT29974.1 MFS transporter [Peribacillus deserti]
MSSLETRRFERELTFIQPFKKSQYFSALFFGQVFSLLGSSITNVILPVVVLQLSNSTAKMGMVMALYMLPFVLLLPFSGVLVDKLNKIYIMLLVDLIRFIFLTILAILAFSDGLNMMFLFVFMFLLGCMDSFFQPAYSSVRAKVFTPDIRNAANSITQISFHGLKIFGPILGGVLITSVSSAWGFGIDAFTYIISFIFLLSLRTLEFQTSGVTKELSIKKDFIEGIDVLKQQSWLWITILAFSFINIFTGGIIRILIPWLINVYHEFEPVVYGLVLSASGAGAIICGIIFGLRKEWSRRGPLAYGGVAICGISLLVTPFASSVPLLMICMFVNGAGLMLFGLIWETSLQELVPEEKFGRVASLDMLGSFALLPLGYLLIGWIAEAAGEIQTLVFSSIIIIVVSAGVMFNKGIRNFN